MTDSTVSAREGICNNNTANASAEAVLLRAACSRINITDDTHNGIGNQGIAEKTKATGSYCQAGSLYTMWQEKFD